MTDTSVMKEKETPTTLDDKFQIEYQKAKEQGFKGSKEEYLSLRDYT